MDWDTFWMNFLEQYHLKRQVDDMNQADDLQGNDINIEAICHGIFDDYDVWAEQWKRVNRDIWELLEGLPGIHLHTSRVKSIESLLEKVITKRYQWFRNKNNKYSHINSDNYKDIITDLVGLRLIISYRGNWLDLHKGILKIFPYAEDCKYVKNTLLPHSEKGNRQAELPKVYYAEGDDTGQYIEQGLNVEQHEMNYRSIHYIISFQKMYVEIQVRTIYDEAWSDCDHSYVYKQDDNKSHTALRQMSLILSKLTNISNDMGEQMRDIFSEESVLESGGDMYGEVRCWSAPKNVVSEFDKSIERLQQLEKDLRSFRSRIVASDI